MDEDEVVNALRAPNAHYTKLIGMITYMDEDAALDAALSAREWLRDIVGNTHYVLVDPRHNNGGYVLSVLFIKKSQ